MIRCLVLAVLLLLGHSENASAIIQAFSTGASSPTPIDVTVVKEDGSGDYTTLSAAVAAASPGDTIEIQGSWTNADTTPVLINIDGLTIKTAGASRHPGYVPASPTHYRLRTNTAATAPITGSETGITNVTIDGLEICQQNDGNGVTLKKCPGIVKNCIIWSSFGTNYGIYHEPSTDSQTFTIENSVFIGFGTGIYLNAVGKDSIVHFVNSCTIYNNGNGIVARNNATSSSPKFEVRIFNTISIGNDSSDYILSGTSTPSYTTRILDHCIDGDGSIATFASSGEATNILASRTETDNAAPGTGSWIVFENLGVTPADLRIKASVENDAQDAHTDPSGAGCTIPSFDIVGTLRPQNSSYDIGVFEVP
jgi:hypothetical protein